MVIFHDPRCADYGSAARPEQPARVVASAAGLRARFPDWTWIQPERATEEQLLLAHTPVHLERLRHPPDFDADTPFFPGIYDHARRAVGAALAASDWAQTTGEPAFSLMRPPGHHATADTAMGFCYLNAIAVTALAARHAGVGRVAVWDFDAHHGNGTETLLQGRDGLMFCSVHQWPAYPGSGRASSGNCFNFTVAPNAPRSVHMNKLSESWAVVLGFRPDLVLVSAGFDAYAQDPITEMTLEKDDFAQLGLWLKSADLPVAAVLEGGYSRELPELLGAFLGAWAGKLQ